MIKKLFSLTEKELDTIQKARAENSWISDDSAAVRHILETYRNKTEKEDMACEIKILLSILKETEKKVNRLLDAVNTILITSGMDTCIPANYMESPVLTKSREYEKEKLAQLKQEKDYRHKKEQ